MRRCVAPGEAGDGEVEAAPPEVDRARLADEAGAKSLEDGEHRRQRFPEARGGVPLIFSWLRVLGEGDGVGDLVGAPVEVEGRP